MSTASNLPILTAPSTPSAPSGAGPLDQGADSAPCAISVRSCTTPDAGTLRVELHGEVDHHSAGPLRVMLAVAPAHGYHRLVLDTSRVTFADSALLRILTDWTDRGRKLRLTGITPAMERLRAAAWGASPPTSRRRARPGKEYAGEGV
ncbi:STAS domain-containing protein [Streptomyces sp. NPDC007355]|uniref:STAS domain-containing protein n=1 Tax=Streptomyces sp. NPDC007355 TaxID=3364778 RepID=UPI003686B024